MYGLHDVRAGKSFCCVSRQMRNRFWIGGKDDWLVTTDSVCDLKLLNPISGETISDGHFAIALFSDGLLLFTSKSLGVWKVLTNPTDFDGCYKYYPFVFLDAPVRKGRLIGVEQTGSIYSWNIDVPSDHPVKLESPNIPLIDESAEHVFYLGISPTDQLILICIHGHGEGFYNSSRRMLVSEHDRFGHVDGMSVHMLDEEDGTWHRIRALGHGQSLFLGLNYPFYGNWSRLKSESVCVANIMEIDVVMFSCGSGQLVGVQAYPVEEGDRLLDGHSMRTPIWFRPTVPLRGSSI
ncbi:hypothetical protein PVAP13_8NG122300 [Panicum virgatum]|uniref:KIB1-4 beta-propeller domain-containing protein n=1 Tax=Panicum virgatum TaxID=38727 RepID=A0A8T0P9P0_PANVG|nr:hypothetical protein PVAP13_8NG122300 [Panicum virgatum]